MSLTTRPLAALTIILVAVVANTSSIGLGWTEGRPAHIATGVYLAALTVLAWKPDEPDAHGFAAAGAGLFWGGRIIALGHHGFTNDAPVVDQIAVHFAALTYIVAHHCRQTELLGMIRSARHQDPPDGE